MFNAQCALNMKIVDELDQLYWNEVPFLKYKESA